MPFDNRPIELNDAIDPRVLQINPDEPDIPEPTRVELARAASELTPTAALPVLLEQFNDDPNFSPDWDLLEPQYQPFVDELGDAGSEREFEAIKGRIRSNMKNFETLSRGGGEGVAWAIGAQLLDPVTLPLWWLPSARMAQYMTTPARTAGIVAGTAAFEASVSETLLHQAQPVRTAGDTVINVTGATMLGGILGYGGSKLVEALGGSSRMAEISKVIDDDVADMNAQHIPTEPQSVGAASASTTMAQEEPLASVGKFKSLNPASYLLFKARTLRGRQSVDELVRHNVLKKKNLEGIRNPIPAEVEITQHMDAPQAAGIELIKKAQRTLRQRGIRMTDDQIADEAGAALRRGDQHSIPEVMEVVKHYRKVFDDWKVEAQKLDILPENIQLTTAASYFPRMYRFDVIDGDYTKWIDMLTHHFESKAMDSASDLSQAEAKSIAFEVTDQLRGAPIGRLPLPRELVPKAGAFKERKLDLLDVTLEKYLHSDVRLVANRYLQSVVPEVVLKRRYGKDGVVILGDKGGPIVDLPEITQRIAEELRLQANALMAKGKTGRAVSRLTGSDLDKEVRAVQAIATRLMGFDRGGAGTVATVMREARAWTATTSLGNIVLASLSDIGRQVMETGLYNFMKTRPAAWAGKTNKQDFKWLAIGLDSVMSTRAAKLADVEDVNTQKALWSVMSRKITPAFFKYVGANRWNTMMKRGAGVALQARFLTDAKNYAKLTKIRKARFAAAGIDEDLAKRIASQWKKHGGTELGAPYANTRAWTDSEAAEVFNRSLLKAVDSTIITPSVGDQVTWFGLGEGAEVGRMITQFKNFVIAAQNQMIVPATQRLRYGDIHALNGILTMVGLGMLQEYVRMVLRHEFDEKKINAELNKLGPQDWIRAGVDRSGITGLFSEGYNLADHVAGGQMSTMLGMSESSRYFFRGGIGSMVPAVRLADTIGGVMTEAGDPGEFTQQDLGKIMRLMPYQNATYAAWLFRDVSKIAGEQLDLPEGKTRKRRFRKSGSGVKF